MTAAHLALRPDRSLVEHLDDLPPGGIVPALRVDGDDRADVPAAFDRSYRRLSADHRRLLRLLALLPASEITVPAAAAAAAVPTATAAAGLETLAAASLLTRLPAQRYRMHVLLREYATRRAEIEDTAAERQRVRRTADEIAAVHSTVTIGLLPHCASA